VLLDGRFELVENRVLQILAVAELQALFFEVVKFRLTDDHCLVCLGGRNVRAIFAQNFHNRGPVVAGHLTAAKFRLEVKLVVLFDFVFLTKLFHFLLFCFVPVEQPLETLGRNR